MSGAPDLFAALRPVVELLEAHGFEYAIGGSLASSAYGIPRATMDVDLVAVLTLEDAVRVERGLGDEFYVSLEMVREAIRERRSFNVIHRPTMMKVDVFVDDGSDFARSVRARRRRIQLAPGFEVWMLSPEDVVLTKIRWGRQADDLSEVQRRDVLGVLRVQGDRMDLDYLRDWAGRLQLSTLLESVLAQLSEG